MLFAFVVIFCFWFEYSSLLSLSHHWTWFTTRYQHIIQRKHTTTATATGSWNVDYETLCKTSCSVKHQQKHNNYHHHHHHHHDAAANRQRIKAYLQAHAQAYVQTLTRTATAPVTTDHPPSSAASSASARDPSASASPAPSSVPVPVPVDVLSVASRLAHLCSHGSYSTWQDQHIQQRLHRPDYNISKSMNFVRWNEISSTVTADYDAAGRGVVSWDDYGARVEHPCLFPKENANLALEMKPVAGKPNYEMQPSRDEFHALHKYVPDSRLGSKYIKGRFIAWIVGNANMWHSFVDDMIDWFCVMEDDPEKFHYIINLQATPENPAMSGVGGFVTLVGVGWLQSFPNIKLVYWPENTSYQEQNRLCIDHITYPRKSAKRNLFGFSYLSRSMLDRIRSGVYRMLGVGDEFGFLPEVNSHLEEHAMNHHKINHSHTHTNKKYKILVYDRKDAWKRVWLNARDLLSRIAPHHDVLYIEKFPKLSTQDQLRAYADTDIFIAEHGAGHMATLFLPRGAVTIQLTSWWEWEFSYLSILESRDKLHLRGATLACSTWEQQPTYGHGVNTGRSYPFTGTRQSAITKSHHPRNAENTICTPDMIFNTLKRRWNIDLEQTIQQQ